MTFFVEAVKVRIVAGSNDDVYLSELAQTGEITAANLLVLDEKGSQHCIQNARVFYVGDDEPGINAYIIKRHRFKKELEDGKQRREEI